MTTPNEELIDALADAYASRSAFMERYQARAALEQAMQSQAEHIAMLESLNELAVKQAETLVKQRDTLRAVLAAIAAAEPVGYAVPTFNFDNSVIKPVHYAGTVPLFTRPMPADVTELVEALEKLASLGNGDQYGNSDGNMIARDALAKFKGAKQ